MIASLPPLIVMALTVWGEARGEPPAGQRAVAWTIRNRADHPCWWGRDLTDVCLKPYQFSCWNHNDPNYPRLINEATRGRPDFKAVRLICESVMLSTSADDDPTNGADHYCTRAVAAKTSWTHGRVPVAEIGNHLFYRLRKGE